jgi:hypothetical protein
MKTEITIQKVNEGTKVVVWVNGEIAETVYFTKREENMIDSKIDELTDFYGGEVDIKHLN